MLLVVLPVLGFISSLKKRFSFACFIKHLLRQRKARGKGSRFGDDSGFDDKVQKGVTSLQWFECIKNIKLNI